MNMLIHKTNYSLSYWENKRIGEWLTQFLALVIFHFIGYLLVGFMLYLVRGGTNWVLGLTGFENIYIFDYIFGIWLVESDYRF